MKRYFGLLPPVLIALAGLAALFCLPARELQPAQAAGNLPQIAEVNVTTQQGEIQDSALQLDAPRLQFSPENLEVNLLVGDTATQTITLTNAGSTYLQTGVNVIAIKASDTAGGCRHFCLDANSFRRSESNYRILVYL